MSNEQLKPKSILPDISRGLKVPEHIKKGEREGLMQMSGYIDEVYFSRLMLIDEKTEQ